MLEPIVWIPFGFIYTCSFGDLTSLGKWVQFPNFQGTSLTNFIEERKIWGGSNDGLGGEIGGGQNIRVHEMKRRESLIKKRPSLVGDHKLWHLKKYAT